MKSLKSLILVAYVAFGLVYAGGCTSSSGGGPPATSTFGNIQIAFVGTIQINGEAPTTRFKNVLLNIANILVNTKSGAVASSKKWRPIPFPTLLPPGSPAGAFQVDLNSIVNNLESNPNPGTLPIVYNTTQIQTGTYNTLQIQFDNAPGTIIPLCAGGALEGCVAYPMQFNGPQTLIIPLNEVKIETGAVTPTILINLALNITGVPNSTGGPYTVSVTPSILAQNSAEALISGTVTGNSGKAHGGDTVTAEIAGTNTVVASTTDSNGAFQLPVPASSSQGTLYDLTLTGGTSSFGALRLPAATPGTPPAAAFVLKDDQQIGAISGVISNSCGGPLPGATVQILVPPGSLSSDLCTAPDTAGECVSVASTTTDVTGNYPTVDSKGNPTGTFATVPILGKVSGVQQNYTLAISAPGFDTMYVQGNATASGNKHPGNCGTPGASLPCDFSLTSTQVAGTVTLTAAPPPGETVTVEVFAEQSGTSNLVAMLAQPLIFTNGTGPVLNFTMPVPSNETTTYTHLDFFAEAIDTFQGATDPYPGHTIIIQQGFALEASNCTATQPPEITFTGQTMDCIGHGSVAGTMTDGDNLTSAVLEIEGVQVISSAAGPVVAALGGSGPSYALCAPGDSYHLQRFQVDNPATDTTPVMTPTPMAIGTPATITVPAAAPTSSGCPTTCSSGATCPGICGPGVNQPL